MDHRIEKFMAVVDYESFSMAAEKLRVSQPALSVAIQRLEKELGVQLIVRGGNFFQVTEEGRMVYEYGEQARLQLKNLKSELLKEKTNQITLRVGMIDSMADALFKSGLVDTSGQLEVRVDNSSRLLRSLRLDQTDVAVITKPLETMSSTYREIGEFAERFTLVCAPELKQTTSKRLKMEHKISDFLTYDQSSTTSQQINKFCRLNGIETEVKFYSTSPDLMKQMALAGKGAALLPANKVAKDVKRGKLSKIPGFEFSRPIIAVVLKDKFVSDEIDKVLALLKEEISKNPSSKRGRHERRT